MVNIMKKYCNNYKDIKDENLITVSAGGNGIPLPWNRRPVSPPDSRPPTPTPCEPHGEHKKAR